MNTLVVNAGSTSVKFKLFDGQLTEKIKGMIDKKEAVSEIKLEKNGGVYKWEDPLGYENAVSIIIKETGGDFDRIGFRVVHGGEKFINPVRITAEIIAKIEELNKLAPLHNPPALKVIKGFGQEFPGKEMFAVFDTAFHATIPEHAAIYAIPYKFYEQNQIKRYGFHGTSHRYASEIFLQLEPKVTKLISCHLGGGASVTAIQNGKSVDTSMGFTPLEGLVMASRSGDIDAGIVLHLQRQMKMSAEEVNILLNQQSGLLGLSGKTADMRTLLELEKAGDKLATLAIAVYVYRIQKYIGSYAAAMNGVDGLLFTAGVGQGSDVLRERICRSLTFLNLKVDPTINNGKFNVSVNLKISSGDSLPIWVIPANEELQIAEEILPL